MTPLPPRDQRYLWLRYQVEGYTEEIVHDFKDRLKTIFRRQVNRVHVLDFEGFTPKMRQDLAERLRMFFSTYKIGSEMGLDAADTLCFQLGGARRSMTWRQFILALGLHIAKDIAEDGFEAYWHAEGRKSGSRLSGGHLIGRLAHHFGLVSDDGLRGLSIVTHELPLIDMVATTAAPGGAKVAPDVDEGAQTISVPVHAPPPPPLVGGRNIPQRLGRHEEEIHGLCQDVGSLRGLMERSMTD
ncbi:hypothetical protein Tco_1162564, partial [Tanacetum coccineum]